MTTIIQFNTADLTPQADTLLVILRNQSQHFYDTLIPDANGLITANISSPTDAPDLIRVGIVDTLGFRLRCRRFGVKHLAPNQRSGQHAERTLYPIPNQAFLEETERIFGKEPFKYSFWDVPVGIVWLYKIGRLNGAQTWNMLADAFFKWCDDSYYGPGVPTNAAIP